MLRMNMKMWIVRQWSKGLSLKGLGRVRMTGTIKERGPRKITNPCLHLPPSWARALFVPHGLRPSEITN